MEIVNLRAKICNQEKDRQDATSKGVRLSYDLDYVILFWLCILSASYGCIRISWILFAFCVNIHVP